MYETISLANEWSQRSDRAIQAGFIAAKLHGVIPVSHATSHCRLVTSSLDGVDLLTDGRTPKCVTGFRSTAWRCAKPEVERPSSDAHAAAYPPVFPPDANKHFQ